jgi:hypothetical protein
MWRGRRMRSARVQWKAELSRAFSAPWPIAFLQRVRLGTGRRSGYSWNLEGLATKSFHDEFPILSERG